MHTIEIDFLFAFNLILITVYAQRPLNLELQIILSYSTYSKRVSANLWLTTIEYLTVILFFL
jgi:hypothetical protein